MEKKPQDDRKGFEGDMRRAQMLPEVAVTPPQDDRKGSSLLYDGSAQQAQGEEVLGLPQSWGGAGNLSPSP